MMVPLGGIRWYHLSKVPSLRSVIPLLVELGTVSFAIRSFSSAPSPLSSALPNELDEIQKSSTKHSATIINGKQIAAEIQHEIKSQLSKLKNEAGIIPGLATILVGSRTDSAMYVRMKRKACEKVGIASFHTDLDENVSLEGLVSVVRKYNVDPKVHGILVQLPLPSHIQEERVLAEISVEKDVDGFHPVNRGLLALKGRKPHFVPCTPRGILTLLERNNVAVSGRHAVVLGRSNVVGLPMALLLIARHATVTLCHSFTQNIADVVRQADIVIVAVGKASLVKSDWIKPGAVVVDVGINFLPGKSPSDKYTIVGDVDFDACSQVASMITPVPGGVGPMTISMLLQNCLDSALKVHGRKESPRSE